MAARVTLPSDQGWPLDPIRLRHLFQLPAPWQPLSRAWEARLLQVVLWLFFAGLGVGALVAYGAALTDRAETFPAVVRGSFSAGTFAFFARALVLSSCNAPLRRLGNAAAAADDAVLSLTPTLTDEQARHAEDAFARDLAVILEAEAPWMLKDGHALHVGIAFVAPSAFAPVHALVLAVPPGAAPQIVPLDTPRRQHAFDIHIARTGRSGHAWIRCARTGRGPRGSAVLVARNGASERISLHTEAVSIADMPAHVRRQRLRQLGEG